MRTVILMKGNIACVVLLIFLCIATRGFAEVAETDTEIAKIKMLLKEYEHRYEKQ